MYLVTVPAAWAFGYYYEDLNKYAIESKKENVSIDTGFLLDQKRAPLKGSLVEFENPEQTYKWRGTYGKQ